MNRRERRVYRKKVRRIGVALASTALLAATAGFGTAAFAEPRGEGGPGGGGTTGPFATPGGAGFGGVILDGGGGFNQHGGTIYCNGHVAGQLPAHTDDCQLT
jgi:hypothetical protein